LIIDRSDGVVTVTLNRPEKKNAINVAMFNELVDTFRDIATNPDDRAVVITGAGDAFCSGADIGGADDRPMPPLMWMRHVGHAALALHDLPQPVIAKVGGVAAGAGLNLALGCDLIVASDNARFSEIFAKRGLSVDFGGSWVLPRLIGLHRAKELVLLADIIDAARARDMGLVNHVVPAAELDALVDDWARRLSSGPPVALSMSKKLLNESMAMSLAQALEAEALAQNVNFTTKDTTEAMLAFIEKREPRFEGR
jgi:2-(1,2-epoxy-1,2-dihydrophenyl)acetyl-CoA isomerase